MKNQKLDQIGEALGLAKTAAKLYRQLTGKPLGITGEIAEFEAARILGLRLSEARQPGYDAERIEGNKVTKVQIKGRRIPKDSKPGQRIGSIRFNHDWDVVDLVILDEDFEPVEIYEVDRKAVHEALIEPGSKARNERGALSVSKFRSIGNLLWSKERGYVE